MNADLAWMSRPFAHRGLHDRSKGIIENSRSAIQAALDQNFGCEVDLRLASCGTVMVFHDDRLERLTHGSGPVVELNKEQLQDVEFRGTSDPMLTLQELLQLVDGRAPLLLEIKSDWPQDEDIVRAFVNKIVSTLHGYEGPFAVMSFDPSFISAFRHIAPEIPRGLISEKFVNLSYWRNLTWRQRFSLRFLLSFPHTRPDFIAYNIKALPAIAPLIARLVFKKPLLTWTVLGIEQQKHAQKYCDAIIFEKFLPSVHQGETSS